MSRRGFSRVIQTPWQIVRRLLCTKSVDSVLAEGRESGQSLKRVLGPVDLVMLGIGAIVGAGIFAQVGTAAAGDSSRPAPGRRWSSPSP